MQVLLIEDDKEIAAHVRVGLEKHGHNVAAVHDGQEGVARAKAGNFDLIILDRMLPSLDGVTALAEMRRDGVRSEERRVGKECRL